ncbi:MAG: tRNA threonylcarbamoyladenosine dehydratase [Atopobiaceae bacterium]|jgi:tRNA A37 threonylcarbamoyladenosine dehydratase|nr:tRNA threonylcarbamoyladenosine dehydratase [Atopobiaceae bacterium]MCH4179884.1 tRNA threonylcarbamoyladenosine dehydratase [Atopobiaceae bacterium]MCH4213635.1 tRNA threonylcarbamoyladenosine dehydratase [Atopobiaceae bacterium]MCH4230298.1 tRNA threonylcarbamoyladenosine dehydratase [Atopobiaceae bacterium]MCH4276008.1 tRNA threonylcarbamoyladenosine dehydratase [Atopobiaceae bacterium]
MEGEASARLELLFSREGLARLAHARVLVLGLGGVGSSCAEALARGGVGSLALVDSDEVSASNVNRQAIAFTSTVGRRKVEVMRDMVLDIDPAAQVTTYDMRVLPENAEALLERCRQDQGGLDYVVDALDTVATKLVMAELCERMGVPLVSSMGAANKVHPERLRFADIYDTRVDPLCHAVRKRARKQGIRHLRVLFSPERPLEVDARASAAAPDDADAPAGQERRGATLGTASFMPPIMGQMLAGDVIRHLTGIDDERARDGR